MKKVILGFFLLLAFATFNVSHAFTTELVTDEGDSATYELIAEPPVESSAVQMRFTVEGGTISSVQEGRDTLLMLGACENGSVFDGNQVCADIAAADEAGVIQEGETLILITVNKSSDAPVTFSPQPDYAYLSTDNDVIAEDGTVLQSYELGEPVETQVTNESSVNTTSLPLYLLIGILVIVIAVFIGILFFSDKKQEEQANLE